MTFFARVWVRDSVIHTVNTTTIFFAEDSFSDWSDEVIDLEVNGEYEFADVLMGRLSYANGIVVGAGITVVSTRPGNPRDIEAELAADRSRMKISFAQLLIGLVTETWITEAEGEAWLIGTLPAAVLAVISTLPTQQQFAAKARALRPSEVLRADPLVSALGLAAGRTEEELDDFFRTYAGV